MNVFEDYKAILKTGTEQLTFKEKPLEFSLMDFWQWSVSDILSNATRGRFAEFINATAVNVDIKTIRDEWGAFDLETPNGIKIEVKSSAYLQTWYQKALSKISFSTKAAFTLDVATNKYSELASRSADVYVFCLLHHENKKTVDPLNLDQWEFYVMSTTELNNYTRSQYSITLASLKKLTNAVSYDKLSEAIEGKNKLNNL